MNTDSSGKNITKCLVGKLSNYLDVDTKLEWLRLTNEVTLLRQLHWGSHLGLPALSLRLNGPDNVNLARLLTTFVHDQYTPVKVSYIHLCYIVIFSSSYGLQSPCVLTLNPLNHVS